MKFFLFTILAICADSARVNTKRNSDKIRVDPSRCADAVPASTMVPASMFSGFPWSSSKSEDSEWCTCPEGQRLLGRNLACSGKATFNPDAVNFQGCDCRVPPAFVCPNECWECCTGSSGDKHFKGAAEFKCILKQDVSTVAFQVADGRIEDELVDGRSCIYPMQRSNNATTWKTYCSAEEWEMQTIPSNGCTSKSKTAKQWEWALEKASEVPGLLWNGGGNMVEMGSIIKYIKDHSTVHNIKYVPLSQMEMIHPIESAEAIQKTAMRARLMRASVSTLDEYDRKFSRALAENEPSLELMSSKEGFQVLEMAPNRYVAFEGNGRLAATRWAFPETADASAMRNTLELEVKQFVLVGEHLAEAVKRITELRTRYQTDEFMALVPPSLEDEDVATYLGDNFPPKTE